MGLQQEKYPYPGLQKYYQMTDGINNTKTTVTPHNNNKDYYSTDEVDALIKGVMDKIVASKNVVTETTSFNQLPDPTEDIAGIIYNISDGFVTDDRFIEGAGKKYPSGSNVIVVKSGDVYKYDILMGEIKEASDASIQDIIDSL